MNFWSKQHFCAGGAFLLVMVLKFAASSSEKREELHTITERTTEYWTEGTDEGSSVDGDAEDVEDVDGAESTSKSGVESIFIWPFWGGEPDKKYSVPSPPRIIVHPSSEMLPFNVVGADDVYIQPLFLECEAEGDPEPVYHWTKNGKQFDWLGDVTMQPGKGSVVITRFSKDLEGYYQCVASNKYGKAIARGVHVREAKLDSFPDGPLMERTVKAGQPLTLICPSLPVGYPNPTVHWIQQYPDGSMRLINSSRALMDPAGNLHFSNVKSEDAAGVEYACTATNPFNQEYKISRKQKITILDSKGKPKVHNLQLLYGSPDLLTVLRGNTVEVHCICAGIAWPKITWTKNGNEVNDDDDDYDPSSLIIPYPPSISTMDDRRILKIRNVDFKDGGRYECKVGSRVMVATTVEVQSVPEWVREPSMATYDEGKSVDFACEAQSVPAPLYEWFMNGIPIKDAEGPVLHVDKLNEFDVRSYQCKASNIHGSILKSFYVDVDSLVDKKHAVVQLYSSPSRIVAVRNKDLEIHCIYGGVPLPDVSWKLPSKVSPMRYTTLDNGRTLKVENVEAQDAGIYQCVVTSGVGSPMTRSFSVRVQSAPHWTSEPNDTVIAEGETVDFPCKADGIPKPHVEWFINGLPIGNAPQNPRRKIFSTTSTLRLKKVVESDSAVFQCNASNIHGYSFKNFFLYVVGNSVPHFIEAPAMQYEAVVDSTVTLTCRISGAPTPLITWTKENKEVGGKRFKTLENGDLEISTVRLTDAGNYRCKAVNRLGGVQSSATLGNLVVRGVPNPPTIISVDCKPSSAVITWKDADDNPILSSSVQYNNAHNPDVWEAMNVPASYHKLEVHLRRWGTYKFRVTSQNKLGSSEPSKVSKSCQTPPDPPYRNPDRVAGEGTKPDNLVITWEPMTPSEHHGPGFFYRVSYRMESRSKWETIDIVDWTQNKYEVSNQPTFVKYRVKVEAFNRLGQATVRAQEVDGYSGEDVPLAAPENFKVIDIFSGNKAVMEWDSVPDNAIRGHFRGYTIQTWTDDMNNMRETIVRGGECPAGRCRETIRTVPFDQNFARILVSNKNYDGPPSEAISFQSPEDNPEFVDYFDVRPMGSNALYLTWSAPSRPNGKITGYNIYFQEVGGIGLGPRLERVPQITDPNTTQAKLGGLRPDTRYRMTITAVNRVGEGGPYFSEAKTSPHKQPTKPPAKPSFTWSNLPIDKDGKAGVKVTWLPDDGHGGGEETTSADSFNVRYREKGQSSWHQSEIEVNDLTITIGGLEENTIYEVGIVIQDGLFTTLSDTREITTGRQS